MSDHLATFFLYCQSTEFWLTCTGFFWFICNLREAVKRECWTYSGLSLFAGETRHILLRDTLCGLCYAYSAFEFFSSVDSRTNSIYGNGEGLDQSRRYWYRGSWTHLGPKLAVGYKLMVVKQWNVRWKYHHALETGDALDKRTTIYVPLKWDERDLFTSGMCLWYQHHPSSDIGDARLA